MFFGKQFIIGTSLLAMHAFQPGYSQFPADSAVGVGPGVTMTGAFQVNAAADEMADPDAPPAELRRQGFNARRIFSRTCDCVRRSDFELVSPFNGRAPEACADC